MTEGPYYLGGEPVRSDITEGRPGAPLHLDLAVATVNGATCRPLPGAAVDVWHADAGGNYSGFGNTTSNRTFLRGTQATDGNGKVTFRTVYPGWYPGRAVHVHVKVRTGASEVHTGQLFFDDAVNTAVYSTSPYDSRGGQWMRNAQDGIYANGGAQSLLKITKEADGYVGTIVMGVRAQV
jgi:protocatechuate 3,4-dioxygenase beta subunit